MNNTIAQIINTIGKMSNDVNDGIESPYEALAHLKELDVELKQALKFITQVAVEEAKYEDKTFNKGEHTFTKVNGRRIFNFKEIPSWIEAKEQLTEIETKHKGAYSQYEKGIRSVNEDGELLELPKVTYTSDTISVKLYSNKNV